MIACKINISPVVPLFDSIASPFFNQCPFIINGVKFLARVILSSILIGDFPDFRSANAINNINIY